MERQRQRHRKTRRTLIVSGVAVVVLVTAFLLFANHGSNTNPTSSATTASTQATSTTMAGATTTTVNYGANTTWAPVAQPSPAGTWGQAPTVTVPSGAAPTHPELTDLIKGSGKAATNGSTLEVQYVLATYSSGKVIQSSWTSQPFSFKLGANTVIPGWEEGMLGAQVGTRRELILPPSLGYGASAPGGGIVANDTLVFVVDVLKIS